MQSQKSGLRSRTATEHEAEGPEQPYAGSSVASDEKRNSSNVASILPQALQRRVSRMHSVKSQYSEAGDGKSQHGRLSMFANVLNRTRHGTKDAVDMLNGTHDFSSNAKLEPPTAAAGVERAAFMQVCLGLSSCINGGCVV